MSLQHYEEQSRWHNMTHAVIMSNIVNTSKCVKIPKIFLLVNHTEDTIEWTIHLDVTVAVAKAIIQMVVIPLHRLAAEEASVDLRTKVNLINRARTLGFLPFCSCLRHLHKT